MRKLECEVKVGYIFEVSNVTVEGQRSLQRACAIEPWFVRLLRYSRSFVAFCTGANQRDHSTWKTYRSLFGIIRTTKKREGLPHWTSDCERKDISVGLRCDKVSTIDSHLTLPIAEGFPIQTPIFQSANMFEKDDSQPPHSNLCVETMVNPTTSDSQKDKAGTRMDYSSSYASSRIST